MPAHEDWFWEGNVQASIVRFLESQGWRIRAVADTASKARGTDIVAELANRSIAIEVKVYPSTSYADPTRAHEKKPTNPVNQAGHWLSHAVLKAMRLQSATPDSEIAIGLPDFPRYRTLLAEIEGSLRRLGVGVYLVQESGAVLTLFATKKEVGS